MTREFIRFAIVGVVGFAVDGGGTWLLTRADLSPFVARVPALVTAMVVTWALNRTLTFRTVEPKSWPELVRYIAVALTSALLNFLLYSGLVLLGIEPLIAVTAATLTLMIFSFFGYRRLVFR